MMKANSVKVTFSENPSPSGDEWFADKDNVEFVQRAIDESKQMPGKAYTLSEINKALGLRNTP